MIWTLPELMATDFPEPRWAVPGLIPEGLTVLAGSPKIGKSWLALSLGIAIASGGKALGRLDVEQGDALYLALEDRGRRLQGRAAMLLAGDTPPERLTLVTEWHRLDDEPSGLDALRATARSLEHPRLIVVDTWAKVRPTAEQSRRLYDDDYRAVEPLQQLAADLGCAVVVIHHLRKQKATDWLETLSGTTGITGAADSVLAMFRERGRSDATLKGTGRDVDVCPSYSGAHAGANTAPTNGGSRR